MDRIPPPQNPFDDYYDITNDDGSDNNDNTTLLTALSDDDEYESHENDGSNQMQSHKPGKTKCPDDVFVRLLTRHSCLMEKAQSPSIKQAKLNAIEAIVDTLHASYGLEMTSRQVRKKLENLRARVKHFSKKKQMKQHERDFMNLLREKESVGGKQAKSKGKCRAVCVCVHCTYV